MTRRSSIRVVLSEAETPITLPARVSMTRRSAVRVLQLLLLTAAAPSLYAQQADAGAVRVAIINVELVVAEAREGKELRAFLQQTETQTRAALEANASRQQSLRQSAVGKGPDERRGIQHQIEDLRREAQRLADDAQRRATKREDETLRQINERLRPIVQQLIGEVGYDLILNASVGGVLHASARVDLTPRVIEMLQAQEQSESESSREP